jgi:DNA polymerase-3 subunit delta
LLSLAAAAYNAAMFFLFHGPDDFSAREELACIRAGYDFGANQDVLAGADTTLATIRTVCDTMPFLAERRLVVVEGLPKPKRGAKADTDADGDEDASEIAEPPAPKPGARSKKSRNGGLGPRAFAQGLADYVPSVPDTTVLVVLVEDQLDATHPLVRAAQQYGTTRLVVAPKGPRLEDWLRRRAAASSTHLAPEAARLLALEVGDNLRMLASEMEKLSTYVGEGGTIRVEDVRALTPASHQARVFDLTDALARRDRIRALALLHELLAAGESPLGIVALTAYQTRTLMQVKALAERGMRPPQIAATAGMAPFVVEKTLPLARQLTFAQLEAAHRALLDIDTGLKLSRMTPELALDLLVVEFGSAAH